MNEKVLKIYINTHKDFECPVKNKVYEVLNNKVNNAAVFEKLNMDDGFLNELTNMFWVSYKEDLPDYIGFCQYRRYFSFMDDVPDIDNLFSGTDAIFVKPIVLDGNIKGHYAFYHNIDDLEIVERVVKEKFPDYGDAIDYVFNKQGVMFIYNMFIMKREDFIKWSKFISGVLSEYMKIIGYDINKRLEENKDKYIKSFPPNNTIEYQKRIGGYLCERLTTLFAMVNFKAVKTYDVVITEDKYNLGRKI